MIINVKKFSPFLFAVILICFFLPFLNVSCEGKKVATFTGIQLVTGTQIQQQGGYGVSQESRKVDPEPLAIIGFIAAIAGLGLSFLKAKKSAIMPAICGAGGFILMLLLKNKIDSDVLQEGQGNFQVQYEIGFWLALIMFIVAAVINVYLYFTKEAITEKTG